MNTFCRLISKRRSLCFGISPSRSIDPFTRDRSFCSSGTEREGNTTGAFHETSNDDHDDATMTRCWSSHGAVILGGDILKRSRGHSLSVQKSNDPGSRHTAPTRFINIRQLDTGVRESSIFSRCYFGAARRDATRERQTRLLMRARARYAPGVRAERAM